MVKVIQAPGISRCVCSHCRSTLEYAHFDIKQDIDHDRIVHVTTYTNYINCPVCHSQVVLGQYFNEWD